MGYFIITQVKNQEDRIYQWMNYSGNKVAKLLDAQAICAVIDVDEFLYTDMNLKVCEVIGNIFSEQSCHQIRVINFDVKDDYNLSKTFLIDNDFSVWKESDLDSNSVLRTRAKCIIKSEFVNSITFVHDLLNGQFPANLSDKSIDERNYSKLKMLHFRKPNLSTHGADLIEFVYDDKINKRIKKNYENTNS